MERVNFNNTFGRMMSMEKSMLHEYMYKIKTMNEKEYLFGVILYSIAPTLAGHKAASIITLSRNNKNLYSLWEKHKKNFLLECGIGFYELKKVHEAVTLLFYDKERLIGIIYEKENINFLKRFGYSHNLNLYDNLQILKFRFEKFFPHEIGIFLGFPLEDVICFMEYPHRKCLLCGYWKVYNNLEAAKEKFLQYDEDKNSVIKYVLEGMDPSLLIGST